MVVLCEYDGCCVACGCSCVDEGGDCFGCTLMVVDCDSLRKCASLSLGFVGIPFGVDSTTVSVDEH